MVRRKNVLSGIGNREHTVGAVWIYAGFGSDVNGIYWFCPSFIGLEGLLKDSLNYAPTIPALAFMAFQLMFAAITLGTITSAMAERMKLSAFIVFGILWTTCLCSISSLGMGWLAG